MLRMLPTLHKNRPAGTEELRVKLRRLLPARVPPLDSLGVVSRWPRQGMQDSSPLKTLPTIFKASDQAAAHAAQSSVQPSNPLHESIFVSEDAPVYHVPMHVIHRPLQSTTDENKVNRLTASCYICTVARAFAA